MISIISAYYGNEEMTIDFLNNLQKKCGFQDVEMILVNAGSKKIDHPFITKRIDLKENKSFSNSFNAGIREAIGQYIVIIGNDGFPTTSDWLHNLQEVLDIRKDVMIVAPQWDNPDFSVYHKLVELEGEHFAFMKMVPAVCWMLRREDVLKIGEFDEQFLIGCYEDDDYCKRVKAIGGRIYVNKEVKLRHLLSQTISKMDYSGAMRDNGARFIAKYGGKE
jgi:GT2 family glycosyltransferase